MCLPTPPDCPPACPPACPACFCHADSIEDKILELQQRKRAVIASAFSGAGGGGASSMAEVMELFSDIL